MGNVNMFAVLGDDAILFYQCSEKSEYDETTSPASARNYTPSCSAQLLISDLKISSLIYAKLPLQIAKMCAHIVLVAARFLRYNSQTALVNY
jgi:hypothetical protein